MRVLLGCEKSQKVCKAFRELGHEAFSCDIEAADLEPSWHIQEDLRKVLTGKFDLKICFPPCTDLATSGARWFKEKKLDGRQLAAVRFFEFCGLWSHCLENPRGIIGTVYRRASQIVHPWQFGHEERKETFLWLNGLPRLKPTNIVPRGKQRIWLMGQTKDRAEKRSITYDGIAQAMALQWGNKKPGKIIIQSRLNFEL